MKRIFFIFGTPSPYITGPPLLTPIFTLLHPNLILLLIHIHKMYFLSRKIHGYPIPTYLGVEFIVLPPKTLLSQERFPQRLPIMSALVFRI